MLHENEREMFSSETLFYSDGYLKHIERIGIFIKKGVVLLHLREEIALKFIK